MGGPLEVLWMGLKQDSFLKHIVMLNKNIAYINLQLLIPAQTSIMMTFVITANFILGIGLKISHSHPT